MIYCLFWQTVRAYNSALLSFVIILKIVSAMISINQLPEKICLWANVHSLVFASQRYLVDYVPLGRGT